MPGKKRSRSSSSETNGKGLSENVSEQQGRSPVASTSAHFPRERVITFMDEEDEKPWVEHTIVDRCSSFEIASNGAAEQKERNEETSTSTQFQPEVEGDVRRSKRIRDSPNVCSSEVPKQLPPSRKVPVPKLHEKYFEGCLVKAPLYLPGYPLWPGMIRKAGSCDVRHTNYIWKMGEETAFCVQFFTELTVVRWRLPRTLRVFDPTKPNRCYSSEMDPTEVEEFEKAIRIAKAAANYSVEARLVKFTFPDSYPDLNKLDMDELLAEVESLNSHHNAVAAEASQNDAVSPIGDDDSALTKVKDRMLDIKRKLQETEEANRSLTTENSQLGEKINELDATVGDLKRQLNLHSGLTTVVISLQENMKLKDSALKAQEKDILKLRAEKLEFQGNLEKEREEKRECQRELEEMRAEFQKLEELFDS